MIQGWAVIGAAFLYLLLLFAVASFGDRKRPAAQLFSRPNIYAFSLAIYCTTWTFFGSVGMASYAGLNFLAIYVGPILLFTVGFPVVARIVRLSKQERITSVADFLGARYGKSMMVAGVATLIAVIGTVPYIALQLKAISSSVSTLISHYSLVDDQEFFALGEISILISIMLALFTILFGTRHADATEHQDGLMLAVAVESAVKLVAFLLVGVFVTYVMFDGLGDLAARAADNVRATDMLNAEVDVSNFLILTLLSTLVFLLLPRQFHVTVVENHSEKELRRGRWLFPVYLVLINLFVVPIAIAGLLTFGEGANADDFVLLLPMSRDNDFLTLAAFLGGLSAGAAMVVVACVALAIMISNGLVLPFIVKRQARHGAVAADMEPAILRIRRSAIFVLMFAAYAYYRAADNSQALSAIGIVSFAAVVQLAPAFFGGLIWQGANSRGAIAGMALGFLVWAYTLLMPTLLPDGNALMQAGPFGNGFLRPQDLFGLELSALGNGVLWSLVFNSCGFVFGSLTRLPTNSEQAQATVFVARRPPIKLGRRGANSAVSVSELTSTVARYLGSARTQRALDSYWRERGERLKASDPVDHELLRHSEQLLASAIGASSSRLVHDLLLKRFEAASSASIRLLDQASEALRYNRDVLQTALDELDQAITVFDKQFRLAFWNKRFRGLLDLPPDIGQAGLPLNEIARKIAEVQEMESQSIGGDDLADRILNETEPWLLALDKAERILEIRTAPMPGGGIVVSWTDITERILVSEALREANETLEGRVEERTGELVKTNQKLAQATLEADAANASKTRFLAAAGHDIMQPLNAARLYTSTLQERMTTGEERQLAVNVSRSLESVEDILGAVLAISRLDTGRQETKPTAFALSRLFEQMAVEFEPFAAERGVRLRFVKTGLWIRSDPGLLRRMLQNLISNAIKYTPSGKVLVGARRGGSQVRIEVLDTGIGIAEADWPEVFVEFRRLKAGQKHAQGLGLGLSIVERISRVLGHEVQLRSSQGKGTRFSVTVPRAAARQASAATASRRRAVTTHDLEGMHVLCIDNEVSILDGMAALLSQWGCRVELAVDTAEALERVAAMGRPPDMVLADYHLDEETGIDAIRAIRRAHGAGVAGALVTADRTPAVKTLAEQEGMPVINKPVRPAALRAVLSSGRAGREAAE